MSALESLEKWYCHAADFDSKPYQVAVATIYEHQEEITNYLDRRSTNAYAESPNAKIKDFQSQTQRCGGRSILLVQAHADPFLK